MGGAECYRLAAPSSNLTADSLSAGLKWVYRWVMLRSAWRIGSWIVVLTPDSESIGRTSRGRRCQFCMGSGPSTKFV